MTAASRGLVWQSARGTVVPWLVEVDKLGPGKRWRLPSPITGRPIPRSLGIWRNFIEEVRRIPTDPVVLCQN